LHNEFPFICFEKGCVKNNFDIKGFKKRMKGKISKARRQMKRRSEPQSKDKNYLQPNGADETPEEEDIAIKGRNVDYFPYLLMFRLNTNPTRIDSDVVMHTNELNDLIPVDKSRLVYRIDTIGAKNILTVYLKKYYNPELDKGKPVHLPHSRLKTIKKILMAEGIPAKHIKILQDSLSPPKL
jgi:hypothetical protein